LAVHPCVERSGAGSTWPGKYFGAAARVSGRGRIAGVANLVINDDTMTVRMSRAEKAEALHRDLTVPRSAITGVRVVTDGMNEVHGLKMPGSDIPGVIMVGTWISRGGNTFAVCHGNGRAIVIELTGQNYDRIVMTVDNPEDLATRLSS
jgi:hypothetical protein